MSEVHLHIQKLQLRLRGVDPATAREVGDRLAGSIAAQLSPTLLTRGVDLSRTRLQLGSISLPPQPRAAEISTLAAGSIGQGLNRSVAEAQPDAPA